MTEPSYVGMPTTITQVETDLTAAERWQQFRANCPHDRKVLVEGGYEREWGWEERDDGTFVATDYGLQSFGDDGDGDYTLRCKTCLTEFPMPYAASDEGWDWR